MSCRDAQDIRLQIYCAQISFSTGYREEAVPVEPPDITNLPGSSMIYYIDLNSTILPVTTEGLGYATLIIKVEDLSDNYTSSYYVLVSFISCIRIN